MSMFGTPKPTASLSSALLARKGQARPAMRPGYVSLNPPPGEDLGWNDLGDTPHYPQPVSVAMPLPDAPPPPVLRQREALDAQLAAVSVPIPEIEPAPMFEEAATIATPLAADAVATVSEIAQPEIAVEPEAPAMPAPLPAETVARVVRAARGSKPKAAFTLRLDPDRHLRLRLATAVRNQSAQQLVTQALDAFLESLTDVDALAVQLSAREGRD